MEIGNRVELLTDVLTKDISLKVHNAIRSKLVHDKIWIYLFYKISRDTWRISLISRNIRI